MNNATILVYLPTKIPQEGKDYHPWAAYGRSKTANILFTYALAEKYGGKLVSLVTDPGSECL